MLKEYLLYRPDDHSIESIKEGSSCRLNISAKISSKIVFLDTFDERLYNAGYVWLIKDNLHYIFPFNSDQEEFAAFSADAVPPYYSGSFARKEINLFLESHICERALLPNIQGNITGEEIELVNADGKTIARGIKAILKSGEVQKLFVLLQPLIGYQKECLNGMDPFVTQEFKNPAAALYSLVQDLTQTYRSKPDLFFSLDQDIPEALHTILQENFKILQLNTQGVVGDIDIEFLHDFRVACRRMRSALGQIKNVLIPEIIEQRINELKIVGKYSGPVRDLDVYLLHQKEYGSMLPQESWKNDLRFMFTILKRRRTMAFRKLHTFMQSQEYRDIIQNWQNFFKDFNSFIQNTRIPIAFATSLISRRLDKILKKGHKTGPKSSDKQFHSLRIECKKLRYMLEFFSSLYPVDDINQVVSHLKKLQDNLGLYNDLSVQIKTLHGFLEEATKRENLGQVRSLSSLISVLNYKKQQLRVDFKTLFREFESKENKNLYRELFAKGQDAS